MADGNPSRPPQSARGMQEAAKKAAREAVEDVQVQLASSSRSQASGLALPFRTEFVKVPDHQALTSRFDMVSEGPKPTPLVQLMGESRGWREGTRVKMYLTLLWWSCIGETYRPVDDSLGPDRPDGVANPLYLTSAVVQRLQRTIGLSSRRAANQSLRDLHDLGFVRLSFELRQGSGRTPTEVRLPPVAMRHESGQEDYYRPGRHESWFMIGEQFWLGAWMQRLSGQALAVLLVLLSRMDRREPDAPLWVASSQIRNWYGFSHNVWKAGVDSLTKHGIIKRARKREPPSAYKPEDEATGRPRATYNLQHLRHDWVCPVPSASPRPARTRLAVPNGAVAYQMTATQISPHPQLPPEEPPPEPEPLPAGRPDPELDEEVPELDEEVPF